MLTGCENNNNNSSCTDMQCSSRGQVNVDPQLVAQLLQLLHHFGFGWRVAPEQSQFREFAVDVVRCGHVGQQHELLHQPEERRRVVRQRQMKEVEQTTTLETAATHLLLSRYW